MSWAIGSILGAISPSNFKRFWLKSSRLMRDFLCKVAAPISPIHSTFWSSGRCWTQTWTRYFVAKLMCTHSDMYMKRWNQSRDDVYWKTHYLESKLHELYSECPCVGSWHILDIFFSLETLPHGKCCYSAPKITREINDGETESWEHGLQERASFVVAAYNRYVY